MNTAPKPDSHHRPSVADCDTVIRCYARNREPLPPGEVMCACPDPVHCRMLFGEMPPDAARIEQLRRRGSLYVREPWDRTDAEYARILKLRGGED